MLTFVVVQAIKRRNSKELHRKLSLYKRGHVFPELLVQLFFEREKQQARRWLIISCCCQEGTESLLRNLCSNYLSPVLLDQEADRQTEGWERPGYYPQEASHLVLSHLREYHRGLRGTRVVSALWNKETPKGGLPLREMLLQQGDSLGHSSLVNVYVRISCGACNSRGMDLVVENICYSCTLSKQQQKKAIKIAWCRLDAHGFFVTTFSILF